MDGPPTQIKNTPESVALAEYLTNTSSDAEIQFVFASGTATPQDIDVSRFKMTKEAVTNTPTSNRSWSNSVGKRVFRRLLEVVGPQYGLWV